MTTRPDPGHPIAAWLQQEAPDAAPERLLTAARNQISATHQRRAPWLRGAVGRATSRARLAVAMAAAITVAAAGLTILPRLAADLGPAGETPGATSTAVSSPSEPSATATPRVTEPAVLSLDLKWTEVDLETEPVQVAWLDGQFVLVDEAGVVSTSSDGATWSRLQPGDPDPGYAELLKGPIVTWEDQIVGWWNPEDGPDYTNKPPVTARDILTIVRPPADPIESSPFEGRIETIGVGPLGIVAQTHSALLDWDAWVTEKLGLRTNNDWTCCVEDVTFQGGVLEITLNNGPGLHVVWADEGFLPGDYQDRGFGWYSPDGVEWTAIPSDIPPSLDRGDLPAFPTGLGHVVGVSDGFIASGETPEERCTLPDGCGPMWHSADGLTWRNLGHPGGPESQDGRLVPWRGGALMTDGIGLFDLWTSEGYRELPMAADFPAQAGSGDPTFRPFATGPLGLVSIRRDSLEILVTRDGVDWKLQPMPAAMVTESDAGPTLAVGERSVLYLTWSGHFGKGEEHVPSLWVGTVEP